ncbi:MAG: FadR/GntR family transcriptional regulator [Arenicella sp.]|jgi:DNA-binding FadR family transcriptional regulator|nr:FadR/GntR family transcriptional regulator [Arenicella sp.]
MLNANNRFNLTQQVAETLGKAIVRGEYSKDKPVPSEAVICTQLEVSRSAAREAVKSLAAKGLISSRARQGIRILPESQWNLFDADVLRWLSITNPSLELIRECAELRVAMEPEAAALAATRQNRKKLDLVCAALNEMRLAETGAADPLEADISFHLSILSASENRFFIQLGRIIDTTLRGSIRFTNHRSGLPAASYADHKLIYDAIVAGEASEAANSSRQLMEEALAFITCAIDERDNS